MFYWCSLRPSIPSLSLQSSGFFTHQVIIDDLIFTVAFFKILSSLFFHSASALFLRGCCLFPEFLMRAVSRHGDLSANGREVESCRVSFSGPQERKGTDLGKEHVGRRGVGTAKTTAGFAWTPCSLSTWGSIAKAGWHQCPGAWLSLRPSRRRSPKSLAQPKFRTFPPAGRGRVLLSLKGKSRPLPGFWLVGACPTPSRAAAGLAVEGESRRRPGSGGQPGAPRWQVGPGPPAPPPPPSWGLAARALEGSRAAEARCAAGSRTAKTWPWRVWSPAWGGRTRPAPRRLAPPPPPARWVPRPLRVPGCRRCLPESRGVVCSEARAALLSLPSAVPLRLPGTPSSGRGRGSARRPWGPSQSPARRSTRPSPHGLRAPGRNPGALRATGPPPPSRLSALLPAPGDPGSSPRPVLARLPTRALPGRAGGGQTGESHPAVRVRRAADPARARGSPHPLWARDSEAGGAGTGGGAGVVVCGLPSPYHWGSLISDGGRRNRVAILEAEVKLGSLVVLWGRVSPVGQIRAGQAFAGSSAAWPPCVHAKEHSGPLFRWQEIRNLEKQPDCRCWGFR